MELAVVLEEEASEVRRLITQSIRVFRKVEMYIPRELREEYSKAIGNLYAAHRAVTTDAMRQTLIVRD